MNELAVSNEAPWRFFTRYPKQFAGVEHSKKRHIAIKRLFKALELIRQGKSLRQIAGEGYNHRLFHDVELPADEWAPEPYTIRVLVEHESIVITVVPPEFRREKHAKTKKKFHRTRVSESATPVVTENIEKVEHHEEVKVTLGGIAPALAELKAKKDAEFVADHKAKLAKLDRENAKTIASRERRILKELRGGKGFRP
jgi:hypothetical protein